jgi:hypothetical protein
MLDVEIAERRADPREDILSMLVKARFEGGEPIEDAEIRDQLMTLLLAGHETTATGLAWTFDLLTRNPPVMNRLVAAVDDGDQVYVRAVVTESLRLRPVVPLVGRRLSARRCMSTATSCHQAPMSLQRSGSPTPAPTAIPSRSPSVPSASSPVPPRRPPGSRSVAA